MAKLILTSEEKKSLIKKETIVINRLLDREPSSSIIFISGNGAHKLWDKVDYCWILGNTASYIKSKKNVGRRKVDYPNNTKNTCNGNNWWDFDKRINPYGELNATITNGIKNKISFKMTREVITGFVKDNEYLRPNIKITISLIK